MAYQDYQLPFFIKQRLREYALGNQERDFAILC